MEATKSLRIKYDMIGIKTQINLNQHPIMFGIVWSFLYLFMFTLLIVLETKSPIMIKKYLIYP